jgi:amino acid transporter
MTGPSTETVRLRRALGLWDLILYGVIVIQPTAPMSVFGVLSDRGRGHVATTIMIAMVAMLFTAISYGRMARAYPSAGSAFTYVGREINPALGYVTGWSMVMDYMLNPMICIVWVSRQAHDFAPAVPYWGWATLCALLFTGLNIQGIRTSAKLNAGLAAGMGAVVAIFLVCAARYIFGHPHGGVGFFTRPFFDPATFSSGAVLGGTSIAVLTYIGFDGISTLSEEAENPRRNILLATVLTCVVIGLLSTAEVYAAQLAWPASEPFPDETTAFVYVAGRTWAPLFAIVGFTLVLANFGSGMGAQLGAARLLFGMGRSNALPKSFFGAIQRGVRRYRQPDRRLHPGFRFGRADAELRGADCLHGRERGGLCALLRPGAGKTTAEPDPSLAGIRGVPAALAEPEPYRAHRRQRLDGRRNRLRGVEDPRLPGGPGEFRYSRR